MRKYCLDTGTQRGATYLKRGGIVLADTEPAVWAFKSQHLLHSLPLNYLDSLSVGTGLQRSPSIRGLMLPAAGIMADPASAQARNFTILQSLLDPMPTRGKKLSGTTIFK